jgi:hypothetical protein
VTFYEHLVLDPEQELTRIASKYGFDLDIAIEEAREPSITDWRRNAASALAADNWQHHLERWRDRVPDTVMERCVATLRDFEIGWVYGADPLPSEAATKVLGCRRPRSVTDVDRPSESSACP